jgi:hypothetical protein
MEREKPRTRKSLMALLDRTAFAGFIWDYVRLCQGASDAERLMGIATFFTSLVRPLGRLDFAGVRANQDAKDAQSRAVA